MNRINSSNSDNRKRNRNLDNENIIRKDLNKRKSNTRNIKNKKNSNTRDIKNKNDLVRGEKRKTGNFKQNVKDERRTKKTRNFEQERKKEDTRKAKRKKGPIRRLIGKIFTLLFLTVIIVGILFYFKVKENGGGLQGIVATLLGQSIEDIQNLKTINILLLGVSEDLDSRLTDTIIVCSYNPQNQMASMISIPRDTFVGKNKETAKGSQKINALYSRGVDKTVKAAEEITGIDIDYYIVVKTSALIEMVDVIGAVEFNVPIDMDYDDPTQDLHIHLKKGMQKINGEKAEQLLRFRHNNDNTSYPAEYGDNDYGRMRTQRAFMTETVKQTLTLKNITRAKMIVDTIFDNIETDLELDDLLPYVSSAVNFSTDNIISNQLPGVSDKYNNIWFFIYDKKETKTMVSEVQEKVKNN
mgnify:CR=1 FL=1